MYKLQNFLQYSFPFNCRQTKLRQAKPGRPLHWQVKGGCFLEKVARELNSGILFHFTSQQNTVICTAHKILKMLPRDASWKPTMCKKVFAAGAPPWTPLGKLTAFPRPSLIFVFFWGGRSEVERGKGKRREFSWREGKAEGLVRLGWRLHPVAEADGRPWVKQHWLTDDTRWCL